MRKVKLCLLAALAAVVLALGGAVACGPRGGVIADTTAPTVTFGCNENYLVALGATFTIPVDDILVLDDVDENVTPTFAVTFDGTAVALNGYTFIAENAGTYTVTVSAVDRAGNRTEKTMSVITTADGEINSFDDSLRVSQARAKGYVALSLNTDPQYIREGAGSLKVQINTHSALGWPGVVVENLPINDISDYYSVSFWVYNDGNDDIEIMLNRNDVSTKARYTLQAHVWNKIEVTARNYDEVFRVQDATAWGEPACGVCEDLKCLTFHFINPANSPQFNLYVDSMRANRQAVNDTLEITADAGYPIAGEPYTLPTALVSYGGQAVEAQVKYALFDAENNEIELTGNTYTFPREGKYTLRIEARYDGLVDRKNYTLIVAAARAENEIDFFESEASLYYFRSEHMDIGIDRNEHQDRNGSTASLKIGPSESIWPYVTIGNVPYSDLQDVAYIYFGAKTDYKLSATQTAYIGLRLGDRNTVVKRIAINNDWQSISFSWQQLYDLGIDTLNGLQLSLELKDTSVTENGGWVPVAFNTYIDNFSVLKTAEPSEKAEGVVMDFENYRDLDDVDTTYTSYQFLDPTLTLNGKGSMQISCPEGRWPSVRLGERFAAYQLKFVKNMLVDVYVTGVEAGHTLRVGVHNDAYTNFTADDVNTWKRVTVPVGILMNGTLPDGTAATLTTLQNVRFTFGYKDTEANADVNLGNVKVYIGKVALEYYQLAPGAEDHVKPQGVLYDFYDVVSATEIKHMNTDKTSTSAVGVYAYFDDNPTSKLVMTNSVWNKIYIPASADEMIDDISKINYVYMDIYVDTTLAESDYLRFTYSYWNGSAYVESYYDKYVSAKSWMTVRIPVKTGTAKLSDIYFYIINSANNWSPIGATAGDAIYFREIGVTSNTESAYDYDIESSAASTGMFYTENVDYAVFRNSNPAFCNGDGSKYSIGLMATPRWPVFFFTDAYVDWLEEQGVTSISFDLYIDSANSVVERIEGIGAQASPINNSWLTVTAQVSSLRGAKIQFNKTAAEKTICYIDNIILNKAEAE